MKHLCIVFKRAPFSHTATREGIDFAMLSASFEQQVSLVFCDEAVLHLTHDLKGELVGSKDYTAMFKAFDLYDIETVYACEQSLVDLGLTQDELAITCEVVKADKINALLQQADEVLVF